MIEVKLYETEDGTVPVQEFLDGVTKEMKAKLLRTISMLGERGYELRAPYSKPLQDGIFELRAQFGGNISRVLYFFVVNGRAILTHGFIKKTQKTPRQEIERAKRYREDYLRREH
ncbi:MAG: type II toxin-antitoxin system RelE/ParE family toxin [Synergistaceae bacterium]|nr:type II toxin-antitoxin system RelE/ParE family toxin [Synergistaceae bacterium]